MKNLLIGTALALFATSATAADLYLDPVPEVPVAVPAGGWYLRGHIGMSNQRLGNLYHLGYDAVASHEFLDEGGFDSAPIGSIGIGYKFNDWLRTDAIVEYRGKAHFSALDRYNLGDGSGWRPNEYEGKKSEWLLMANAYVDLGDYNGIVPYVGAGIGMSRNTISHFRDINLPNLGVAYAGDDPTWNFAWALHAGIGYQVTDRLTLDVGYTYLNLGDAKTATIATYDGSSPGVVGPMEFHDITSHDFKVGLRYSLQ